MEIYHGGYIDTSAKASDPSLGIIQATNPRILVHFSNMPHIIQSLIQPLFSRQPYPPLYACPFS